MLGPRSDNNRHSAPRTARGGDTASRLGVRHQEKDRRNAHAHTLTHTRKYTHTHTHTDTRTHTSTGVSTRPHYEHISIPGRYQLPAGPSDAVARSRTHGRTQASLYHQYRSASARSLNCHLYSQRPQPADIRTLCFVFFTFLSFEPGTSRSRVPRLGSAL